MSKSIDNEEREWLERFVGRPIKVILHVEGTIESVRSSGTLVVQLPEGKALVKHGDLESTGTEASDFLYAHAKRMLTEAELADALDAYTDPNSPEYDPEFDAKVRAARPDWFAANEP